MYTYTTQGTCARSIDIELEGDTVSSVVFHGGCNGNLKAISKLIAGKSVDEIAEVLEGNTCGPRNTSCADQLVKGLREAQARESAIG